MLIVDVKIWWWLLVCQNALRCMCILIFYFFNFGGDPPGPSIGVEGEGQGKGRVISAKRGKVCFLPVGWMDAPGNYHQVKLWIQQPEQVEDGLNTQDLLIAQSRMCWDRQVPYKGTCCTRILVYHSVAAFTCCMTVITLSEFYNFVIYIATINNIRNSSCWWRCRRRRHFVKCDVRWCAAELPNLT